jgi:predicted AAA+ superfamily ATPase
MNCAKYAIVSYILRMRISRDLEGRLKRSAKTRSVIVLTGARQTGRISTFRHLFPDYAFVSLDFPTEAEQAEKEPERFLQRNPPLAIIDQVQYAPGHFRHLKVAVDARSTRNGQFLLTGSQKFTQVKNVSELLAARADIVELETLSFAEIREALPNSELESAMVRGGFPELYANPDIDSVSFYNSYLATYLERNVRALANVGSLRDFERFLRACALRSANLLKRTWRGMSACHHRRQINGCPCWKSPATPCCSSHGSRIEPSPLSRVQNSTLPTPACSVRC